VEIMYERVAAIDVGKKIIAVAVRTPGERAGKRRQQVRKYNTFHQTLTEMVAWLTSEGVTHVTMEATGIYWKPIVRHAALWNRAGVKGPRDRSVVAGR
jgi:transposase